MVSRPISKATRGLQERVKPTDAYIFADIFSARSSDLVMIAIVALRVLYFTLYKEIVVVRPGVSTVIGLPTKLMDTLFRS